MVLGAATNRASSEIASDGTNGFVVVRVCGNDTCVNQYTARRSRDRRAVC